MKALEYRLAFNSYQFIIDGDKVVDFALHRHAESVRLGDIYLAKIENCDDQFCFLDIGQAEKLFIRKKDMQSTLNKALCKQGERLYVQVNAMRRANKWARATATFELTSTNLVLTTDRNGLFISNKITDQTIRGALKTILNPLMNKNFGLVVRTRAKNVEYNALLNEATQLIANFNAVLVSPVEKNYNPLRYRSEDALFNRYYDTIEHYIGCQPSTLKFPIKKGIALYQQFDLLAWLRDNQRHTAKLPSGIELTIEELEAMTVVDIDSAAFKWQSQAEDFSYAVNWAALNALPSELAKRKISGNVLVDCLTMPKKEQRFLIQQAKPMLQENNLILKEMTASGLLELSIKNSVPSVKQSFYKRSQQAVIIKEDVLIDYWLDYMIYYCKANQQQHFYFMVSRDIYYKMQTAEDRIKTLLKNHDIRLSLAFCEVADGIMQPIKHGIDTIAEKSRKTIDLMPFI